jgi:DNA invertase Pin-like site-specific DNA recombinase
MKLYHQGVRPIWKIHYLPSETDYRVTRSLMHLLQLVREFEERGINLVSLRDNIDTRSATGRAFLSIIGAINQMERELKAERAAAGRQAA